MPGLVAAIAREPALDRLPPIVDRLVRHWEDLRGAGARDTARAGERGIAVVLGRGAERGIRRAGPAWFAAAGLAHGADPARLRADELDGQFGAVHFDGAGDVLVLADPFGMQALFVAEHAGVTLVCDSPVPLAAEVGAGLDELGAAAFVRLGIQVGRRTLWSGVRRLEPGTLLRLRAGRPAEEERYWRPSVDPAVRAKGFDGTVTHCVDALVETFRTRFGDAAPAWADLTGGYDSRLMDVALARAGVPFVTSTTTHADGGQDSDLRLAEEVAQVAGWPWTGLGYGADWPERAVDLASAAVGWSGAQLPVLGLGEVLWHHRVKAATRGSLFNGGGGEHFWNYAWQHELLAPSRDPATLVRRWVTVRMLGPETRPLLRRALEAEAVEDLTRTMAAWIEPYRDAPRSTQLDLLYAYKSVGHFGAYRSAGEGHLSVQTPFYLKPVFTAAISARPAYRLNHRLMRHMLHVLDPRVAAVTTAKGGPAAPLSPRNAVRFLPYWGLLARKGVNKLASATVNRAPFSFAAPTSDAVVLGRTRVLDHLRASGRVSSDGLRAEPLYEPRVARAMLASPGGAPAMDEQMDRLITVELALEASAPR